MKRRNSLSKSTLTGKALVDTNEVFRDNNSKKTGQLGAAKRAVNSVLQQCLTGHKIETSWRYISCDHGVQFSYLMFLLFIHSKVQRRYNLPIIQFKSGYFWPYKHHLKRVWILAFLLFQFERNWVRKYVSITSKYMKKET